VGPSELPLFVGVAVLRQLSAQILALKDFNQILEMFTELPPVDVQQLIEDTQHMFNRTPWPSTCSEYAMHRRSGEATAETPVAEKITLAQLQEELCPRIYVRDLIEFQSELTLVDLRPAKQFAQLHLQGALSCPLKPDTDAEDVDIAIFSRLHGRHIVLCDADSIRATARATVLAKRLVAKAFPHVSVLHGGFEHLVAQTPDDLLVFKG
jgi:rhodanese-related sulfurtransferase